MFSHEMSLLGGKLEGDSSSGSKLECDSGSKLVCALLLGTRCHSPVALAVNCCCCPCVIITLNNNNNMKSLGQQKQQQKLEIYINYFIFKNSYLPHWNK